MHTTYTVYVTYTTTEIKITWAFFYYLEFFISEFHFKIAFVNTRNVHKLFHFEDVSIFEL